jgi:hypothetical protein
MPPTVIVNMITAVHSGSIGQSIAFPDVCKTPAPPAPPIPIPYPNIAMSSDAASEASKVMFDGSKLMVKGSNIMMSTGDEAGALMGVVSNKIKGKAEFVNYSFDVKADGKNVCRLTDPMTQNMGDSPNAFGPAEVQASTFAAGPQKDACDKVNEQKKEQGNSPDTNWGESGVHDTHRKAFTQVAKDHNAVIHIRATNKDCGRWIGRHHAPKPHSCFNAKTISKKNVGYVKKWHARMRKKRKDGEMVDAEQLDAMKRVTRNRVRAGDRYDYSYFHGIVMRLDSPKDGSGPDDGKPLRYLEKYDAVQDAMEYSDVWVTGDYDLMDILYNESGCLRPDQHSDAFLTIRRELNGGMGWDGIQHGPQAQWVPNDDEGFSSDTDFPEEIEKWVNSSEPTPPKIKVSTPKGDREMPAYDKNLTTVYPGGVVHLKEDQNAKDALICMGCQKKEKK